jgi:beta-galactosidase
MVYTLAEPWFRYGAVYFRKSGPPRRDWERDYARAAKDGFNVFRHWFIWGAIEVAPGVYGWEDYDRQLELAEKYGIKTVIAEITHSVPQWLLAERPDLRPTQADGRRGRKWG